MDRLSRLVIDKPTDDRFNRLFRSEAKKRGFTVAKIRDNYCSVSDGERSLKFDISPEKYAFARTRSVAEAQKMADRVTADFEVLDRMVSFTNGQNFLRFLLIHGGEVKKGMITSDFYGGLKRVLCTTSDDIHARILDEKYLREWDTPAEVLFSVADRNMSRAMDKLVFNEGVLDETGNIRFMEFMTESSGFAPAMIACSGFYDFVRAHLGNRFLVIAPSKDVVAAVTEPAANIYSRFRDLVTENNRWSSDPLTTAVLLYTPQGTETVDIFPDI